PPPTERTPMKFKVTAIATEVRAGTQHEITATLDAASATDACSDTITTAAQHGYQINGLPQVEQQD
ncbi:hypothetical protein, partial [Streptomyces bottropensis]|uniref:hypothetical protein n=1 Tax=Streptomyces bottropensis TaxID=42235 RepID=UPI003686C612